MQNEVRNIRVQKLKTQTEWDEETRKLTTTITVKTNIAPEIIAEIIELQKLNTPLYITIGSDQAKLKLD